MKARNKAYDYCIDALQTSTAEKCQFALETLANLFEYDRFCKDHRLLDEDDAALPSLGLLASTRAPVVISNWLNGQYLNFSNEDSSRKFIDFILDYLAPYTLLLEAFGQDMTKIEKFFQDNNVKISYQAERGDFLELADEIEKVFEGKVKMTEYFHKWKQVAAKILIEKIEGESFFEIGNAAGATEKQSGVLLGGLAFLLDLLSMAKEGVFGLIHKLLAVSKYIGNYTFSLQIVINSS